MASLSGVDGFLDRFLFLVSRPMLYSTDIVKDNFAKLVSSSMQDFTDLYIKIYEDHETGRSYKLSEEAQVLYDEMVDSFAEFLNDKYSVNGR